MMLRQSKKKKRAFSDLDDDEIRSYLHTDAQARFKQLIWESMNRDYLAEQAAKKSTVGADARAPENKKPRRAGENPKAGRRSGGGAHAETEQRRSSKINYDALAAIIGDLDNSRERQQLSVPDGHVTAVEYNGREDEEVDAGGGDRCYGDEEEEGAHEHGDEEEEEENAHEQDEYGGHSEYGEEYYGEHDDDGYVNEEEYM